MPASFGEANGVFGRARVDSLAEIASQYEEFQAPAGTTFWCEGDPGGWFFVVLEGTVDSRAANGLHFSWTSGMTPGVFEARGGVTRWHDASAATPVRGLRLIAERLFDAPEDDFAMTVDLLWALAAQGSPSAADWSVVTWARYAASGAITFVRQALHDS